MIARHPLFLREKLLSEGSHQLSDAELLAVFISSGSKNNSCLQLAMELLQRFGDVRAILNADLTSFKQVSGLGMVRYIQLQAAREICRRSDFIGLKKRVQLNNTHQTYTYLKRRLRDKTNETFVALFLDNQHRIITYEELFTGTINSASVHPRLIVERILKLNAAALILAHNHPSGLSNASEQDRVMTARLKHAVELVDARLLDHLVIGDNEVYSILNETKWTCN